MDETDLKFVEKYGIKIENKEITDKNEEILLIRHGFSMANHKEFILENDFGLKWGHEMHNDKLW
jgi:hypothetical protein